MGLIPGLRIYPGKGNGNPFQYPCPGNPMGGGAWWDTVHEVARVRHNLATKPPHHILEQSHTHMEFKWPYLETKEKERVRKWREASFI